jgi:ketosteroid isomerase-like protein
MENAATMFRRALDCLLAFDIDGYAEAFAPDGTIEWPFAPDDWPHRRASGRKQIREVVGANIERARAMGRRLVALHDVVVHESNGGRDAVVEFCVEVQAADGASTRLPYVHVLHTTDDGHIASLRDYFGGRTARVAREGLHLLSTEDRVAIHELVALHGHLADDRRTADLDQLVTEDVIYDLTEFGLGVVRGRVALAEMFDERPGNQPVGHHVTNVTIKEAEGVVRVRSKGLVVMTKGRAGTVIYDDEVRRTAAGWRIAHRKVIASTGGEGALPTPTTDSV